MLTIKLLGDPQILSDGQPLDVTRRKSRALVYYVAAQERPVQREHLLNVFWADNERSTALQTLRTTLHGLRKDLGEGLLVDDNTVALAMESQVDARLFEQHLEEDPDDPDLLQKTIELYRGDFLADFLLPDTPAFEEWLVVTREHYRRLIIRAWTMLSQIQEKNTNFKAALEALERALAFDQLQEDLQRESIRLMYLSGDRPAAIRRYDQLRKLLDEEMGVPPMEETRHLYDAILNDTLSASNGPTTTTVRRAGSDRSRTRPGRFRGREEGMLLPFTGRQRELELLQELTASHKLVLIEGEAGIGKTRLAEEFIRTANAIPLIGAARELEHHMPYQPIIEALRSLVSCQDWPELQQGLKSRLAPLWLAEAARLLPELSPTNLPKPASSNNADESRLWEGVNQLLVALGQQRLATLFIDDLHWADTSTLGMLGYLVRQENNAALLFLATARSVTPRSPLAILLQALTRENRLERMQLARLTSENVTSISHSLSPKFTYPLADWLMHNSEGNPFILHELVQYARQQGILYASQDQELAINLNALSASPVVPWTVYSLIQSRLEQLSDTAWRVLAAGVAAGREFEFEVVARAAALSESAALDALDELRDAGLIQAINGMHFRFNHSLIMEVVYREVGEPRHRLMHRRVGEALENIYPRARRESQAGVIAFHFSEGLAADRAAPYAVLAGQQAIRLAAWSEACSFYEIALEGSSEEQKFPILIALGEVHMQAGQAVQASEINRDALTLALNSGDPIKISSAQLALARSNLSQARYEEAISLARKVQESGRREEAMQAEFIWGTGLSLEGADLESAAKHLKTAQSLCQELCDELSADGVPAEQNIAITSLDYDAYNAQIQFELGSVVAQQGNLEKAIDLYQHALEAAHRSQSEQGLIWQALALNNLAYHSLLLEDPAAVQYAEQGLALAQEKGLLGQQAYLYSTRGEIALAAGQLDEAERYFKRGLSIAEQLSNAERVAGLKANLGLIAIERGQTSLAIHRLSTALAEAESLGTHHLAARIRLWLVPLLPADERAAHLTAVRSFARSGGRKILLDQVRELEKKYQN